MQIPEAAKAKRYFFAIGGRRVAAAPLPRVNNFPDERNWLYLRRRCREGRNMRRISLWLSFSLCVAALLTAIADAAPTERLIFLSTQLRPIEEAQKMRNLILKDFPREVDYITEQPQQFPVRI